jgi:cysteinyl-tRNA synthetase
MKNNLHIYNTLTKKKEKFEAINPPFVGLYVCGPTVYSDVHLGNMRTFNSFDIVYRYLMHLGYDVRYVRNITDVGHLVGDGDEGDDKIEKKAKQEQIEPMQIVQKYTNDFKNINHLFNLKDPDIEPTATGHIIEQIEMVQKIIDNGYAYVVNGSVYFDVQKYMEKYEYGTLSGRKVEELLEQTRDNLAGASEKKYFADFVIWKNASEDKLMKWNNPWGQGVPGWHMECSVMSTKYLGERFDIHGGGMDLKFPHHECEIAQNVGATGVSPVKYWMHTNMLTVNGTKMSKSLGNSFLPHELFTGDHPLLERGYSPMVVKFFMLQSHYSSTLDFSNDALKASEKGFQKLMIAYKLSANLPTSKKNTEATDKEVNEIREQVYAEMNNDFSTPKTIAKLFDFVSLINKVNDKTIAISAEGLQVLQTTLKEFIEDVLGLKQEETSNNKTLDGVMDLILDIRKNARESKDWSTSDLIRDKLNELEIKVKDGRDGASWEA